MEGNPFFEPTQELAFIRNLANGGFTVLHLPTQVNGIKRWRLIGNESGLVGYWRFDEGAGNKAFDQTDTGNSGTINGTPQWVASDAPIGDHPGMRRSSFSFTGRRRFIVSQTVLPTGRSSHWVRRRKQTHMVRGEPCHVLINRTDSCVIYSISSNNIRIGTASEYWYSWGGDKYGGLNIKPSDSNLEVTPVQLYNNTRINQITSEISQKQTQLNAQTTLVNSLLAQQALLPSKQSLLLQKQNSQTDKQNQLSVLTGGERQEIRLAMGFVHLDASGLTVNGSLMKFASSTKTPSILDTATGELALYYPADVSNQFTAAYFQTLVARTRLQFSSGAITLLSRAAGSNNITATISNGRINNTCNLVIANSNRSIIETWNDLPRDPQKFADILNGQGERPATVTATVSPLSYSVKERSLQVVALSEGRAEYQNQTVSQSALNFDGQNDYIDLPPEMNNLINEEITIEFWAKGGAGLPKDASIFDAENASGQRIFTIHFPWTNSLVTWDAGDAGNCDRLELSVQNEALTAEQWHHIAIRFRQSYGLSFNAQSYLDCGNNEMLDIGEDMTIEAFIQINSLGTIQGILGKGYLDQPVSHCRVEVGLILYGLITVIH